MNRTIQLMGSNFLITLTPYQRGYIIESNLHSPDGGNDAYHRAIDAVESLVLAHACAGVDVQSAAYLEGINAALDGISSHLGD